MLFFKYRNSVYTSHWLRAVQYKYNASAKSVTPVQITNQYSRHVVLPRLSVILEFHVMRCYGQLTV